MEEQKLSTSSTLKNILSTSIPGWVGTIALIVFIILACISAINSSEPALDLTFFAIFATPFLLAYFLGRLKKMWQKLVFILVLIISFFILFDLPFPGFI